MKIRRRQTPDQLRTLCWYPNRRRARRRHVSNPDCAADARLHACPEQHPLRAAPLLIGCDCQRRACSLASRFSSTPSLTMNRLNQIFWRFFVSLNGSASGRSNGGTKFRPANAVRIGAHDARHREHLMAPDRQLTSSATLKGKGCREIRLLEVRRLVARVTLRLSRRNLVESNKDWAGGRDCNLER